MRKGTALVFEFVLSCNGLRLRLLETMSRDVYIQWVCCRVESRMLKTNEQWMRRSGCHEPNCLSSCVCAFGSQSRFGRIKYGMCDMIVAQFEAYG